MEVTILYSYHSTNIGFYSLEEINGVLFIYMKFLTILNRFVYCHFSYTMMAKAIKPMNRSWISSSQGEYL